MNSFGNERPQPARSEREEEHFDDTEAEPTAPSAEIVAQQPDELTVDELHFELQEAERQLDEWADTQETYRTDNTLSEEVAVTNIVADETEEVTESEKAETLERLEREIEQLLDKNLDAEYEPLVTRIREEKVSWITSDAFAERLRRVGAEEEDVEQIKECVLINLSEGKVHVFAHPDLVSLRSKVMEYFKISSGGEDAPLERGRAFHISGATEHMPSVMLNNVYVHESVFDPNVYPPDNETETILRHEIGHQIEDGVLASELYQNWSPRLKENSRDPEYFGNICEVDVRVRAMFSALKDSYTPTDSFGVEQLEELHALHKARRLEPEIAGLLEHYDDEELIRIANLLPAI